MVVGDYAHFLKTCASVWWEIYWFFSYCCSASLLQKSREPNSRFVRYREKKNCVYHKFSLRLFTYEFIILLYKYHGLPTRNCVRWCSTFWLTNMMQGGRFYFPWWQVVIHKYSPQGRNSSHTSKQVGTLFIQFFFWFAARFWQLAQFPYNSSHSPHIGCILILTGKYLHA